jgi:DNA-binding FadR family transcriptional regulator
MAATPKRDRLYEVIVRDLAERIGSGAYPIGSRLPSERQLADQYKVSRPTLREALIALELDQMVEVRKGSGVYVLRSGAPQVVGSDPDIGPFELLEARRLVECEICAFVAPQVTERDVRELHGIVDRMELVDGDADAAEALDREFHLRIAQASQNSALVAMTEMLWNVRARSPLYRFFNAKAVEAGVLPSVKEHRSIVAALDSKNAETARRAMHAHLARASDNLMEATEFFEVERARERVALENARYRHRASSLLTKNVKLRDTSQ